MSDVELTREDALLLVNALNRISPHLAPVLFEAVSNNTFIRVAAAVANGKAQCSVTSVAAPPTPMRSTIKPDQSDTPSSKKTKS
jgi:hypothetical protein